MLSYSALHLTSHEKKDIQTKAYVKVHLKLVTIYINNEILMWEQTIMLTLEETEILAQEFYTVCLFSCHASKLLNYF